jgi:glycosyltransferase involved in cell wall biosynthesis
MMSGVKALLLHYMSGDVSATKLAECSAILQRFVACERFGESIAGISQSEYTRISIIMPSYNQAGFIERSILSVLNQNYPNLQFIIMDGGSTDGTVEVIRKYDRRLVWRSEPDRGQSDAINKCLAIVDGELVGWLNSDDVYFPGALLLINKFARRRPGAVLYSGIVAMINRDDHLLRIPRLSRPTMRSMLFEGFSMLSQGVFWRREAQSRAGFFDVDLHYAMDFDFWMKLLAHGDAEFLPEILGGFRIYGTSKTSSAPERGYAEVRAIRNRYGVDDTTARWRLRRNLLFLWKVVRRRFAIEPHDAMMAELRCEGILEETRMPQS